MLRTIGNFLTLARLPFHLVGILPFLFGALLSVKAGAAFDGGVFWLSLLAVMLTISATHFNGECYDIEEDSLCSRRSIFSSGTGIAVQGKIPPAVISRSASVVAALALSCGAVLQFGFRTGPLTLALGAAALFSGYFYSKPPLRLVKRGVGELLIGFCYGWLVPVSGFYPQAGYIHPLLYLAALPIALVTVNVIWINEILDFPQDQAAGKRNMVVRLGPERAVRAYKALALAGAAACAIPVIALTPGIHGLLIAPAVVLSFIAVRVINNYADRRFLLAACGLTLAADLSAVIAYLLLVARLP